MKTKTSELEGVALDWAVGLCMGWQYRKCRNLTSMGWYDGKRENFQCSSWKPSTDWSQGGPLVEKNNWALPYRATNRHHIGKYEACTPGGFPHNGATPLIAAMRAIVAAKLGDTVDVPDELL